MYTAGQITELINRKIEGADIFIVEINVTAGNRISVFVDSNTGVSIDQCVEISRFIEENLDREKDDFELEVSSAGIGYPFKVKEQYLKNIGKDVEVILMSGEKLKGALKEYNDENITIEVAKMMRVEGKKKKQLITEEKKLEINKIKSTKEMLFFK